MSSIFTKLLAEWTWNSLIVKYADSIAGNKSTKIDLISVCEAALLIILWLTIVSYPDAYLFFEIVQDYRYLLPAVWRKYTERFFK